MRLFDFLMNRKSSAAPVSKPSLSVLQMDATGGLDAQRVADVQNYINSPEAKAQAIAPTLAERLFGRDITTDTQTIDPETNAVTMETKSLHQPGYLEQAGAGLKRGINDLLGGYNENRTQNFSVDNWNNNYLDNGNKKGLAYRLGEGLGSFAKLAESPIGRSLLVGGIVGATGGDGLQALTYGAQTGMMNQQNRAKDQMYRKALAERGIDTSGIRGYVGDSMFKSILEDAQLRDNAEYRNAMLQTQVNNQREMMEYRKQEAERQARQDQQDNYFRGQQIAQGWEKLKQGENKVNTKEEAKRKQSQSTLNMIGAALGTVEQSPEAFGFWKGVSPNEVTNRADAQGVQARAIVDSVTAEYRKYLTGAQMSDKERKDYEKFLPNPRDNADIIMKKLQGMQTVIQAREGLFEDVPNNSTPSINVDRKALEKEAKRRGLK